MIKGAIFFLLVMVAIGLIGNAIAPGSVGRVIRRQLPKASSCSRCGRYLFGKSGCDCRKG